MKPQIKISDSVQKSLRCPVCHGELGPLDHDGRFHCLNDQCQTTYPTIDGIPCLINENSSIFSFDDFIQQRETTLRLKENKIIKTIQRSIPSTSNNIKAKRNYRLFAQKLLKKSSHPRVLVLGGSILGQGMEAILSFPAIEFVETDVSFGPRTTLICDAHDIPFVDGSFDGVIVQAVLEHVVDSFACVEEIHRVLKKDGLVYAETPFIQQVHGRQYDFMRFTHLGHRRLFRKFTEIESGAVCGTGMALAWSYEYFLLSFVKSRFARRLVKAFAGLTSFYLKYFDHLTIDKPGTLDAASGYYFMGKKSDTPLADKELIKLYRGAIQ